MLFEPSELAVVTGASGGIGAAIARELAAQGAPVVVHYRRNAEAARDVVDSIRSQGGRAIRHSADLCCEDQVREMFHVIRQRLGQVRLLVNNAGVTADGLAPMMSGQQWTEVVDTNLSAAFYCAREALRAMSYARRGAIVNVSSVAGLLGNKGQANYAAAKAGLIGLTRSLAREMGPSGIRVNSVAPGLVQTQLSRSLPSDYVQAYLKSVPLRRLCTPEDVASVVVFLLSDKAGAVTGQTVAVDGGLTYG
jgi:3-oxoacyl-[acyl-carrier protein] reductase